MGIALASAQEFAQTRERLLHEQIVAERDQCRALERQLHDVKRAAADFRKAHAEHSLARAREAPLRLEVDAMRATNFASDAEGHQAKEWQVRLIPKRRFAHEHFEHTRKGGSVPPKMKTNNQLKTTVLEIAHTNFVSSIRKKAYQPLI